MHPFRSSKPLILLAACLASRIALADNWQPLTGSERLHAFVSGATVDIQLRPDVTAVGTYHPDGTARIRALNETFERTWKVKSDQTESFVRFDFADGATAGLDIRRAIAEFVPSPDDYDSQADITLKMSGETWAKVYLSQATPQQLIGDGEIVVDGDAAEAARLLNLFDRYSPAKAVVVRPAFLEHGL